MPDAHRPVLTLWRAYVPRWSYLPLSGEGAARFGGRWNPIGSPTIYAACELSTAWAEYNQGFVQHPAVIVRLELEGAKLANLNDAETLSVLEIPSGIHREEWRATLDKGREPEAHRQRTRLIQLGHDGVIYPSFMSPGGSCVAIWRWNVRDGPTLRVVDPEGRLPVSPASWV